MKLTKVFAALAMVALAATACQNEPEAGLTPEQGAKVISVTPSFFSFNRATDTAFEEGDQIGLHIITDATYLNNALYTYTGGALTSTTQNMWYKDEEQVADVVAYYPYSAQGAYTAEGYTFAVKNDQSVEGNYTASDLMVAYTTSKPTAEAVVLPFKHALSKIVVKVNNLSTATVDNVYITNVYTSAVVDLKNGTSTVEGELATVKGASIAAGEEQAWTMIVVPQTEATPKLVVTTSAGQFTFNITAATDLEAGKVASTTLTIDKELIPTDFTPEISDWESNEDLEFNPSDENTPVDPEGGEGEDPIVPDVPAFVAEATDLGVVGSFEASANWNNDVVLYTTPTEGLLVAKKVQMEAYDEFKIRTLGSWEGTIVGATTVNYIQVNKYFTASDAVGAGNIFVEAAGTYDIYYNVNTKAIYLMTVGADITEATEQTTNGQEPPYEEPEVSENVLYLAPSVWSADGAWFAAYFFIEGGATSWVKMTDEDTDGVFEVNIPVGFTEGANVIFCRMDPAKTAVDWGSKWNQTADLTIGENNLYTISDWGGEKSPGAWSTK